MIGVKLKEIREKTGMNKKEFADYIGIKYTTYNNYETEAREPASDFLILISTKFDVSIDYLLGMQDTKDITHAYQLKSSEFEHIKKIPLPGHLWPGNGILYTGQRNRTYPST